MACCNWKAYICSTVFHAGWTHEIHTRSPFGLIRKAYRQTQVDTIASIKFVVESSSTCGATKAQLIHDTDGHIQVPFYN